MSSPGDQDRRRPSTDEAGQVPATEAYRVAVEGTLQGVVILQDFRVVFANPAIERLSGYTRDELVSFSPAQVRSRIVPEEREPVWRELEQRAEGPVAPFFSELRVQRKDGEIRWVEVVATRVTYAGRPAGLFTVLDITERKQTEQALRENEARFRLVTEGAREYVSEIDEEGRFAYVSSTVREQLGHEPHEFLGLPAAEIFLDLVHPEDRRDVEEGLVRALAGGAIQSGPFRVRDRAGRWHWLETAARPFRTLEGRRHLVAVSRDVCERLEAEAERRRLLEQVMRARRLEGLGVLAGGVAHDFNNLLVAIRGNAELALLRLDPRHPARPLLEDLDRAAGRATELTRSLLTYAGKGWVEMAPVDLSALVRETLRILRSGMPPRTRVEAPAAGSGPWVEADSTQLGQVVMNLLTNAAEALEGEDGAVAVRVGVERLDRAALADCLVAEGLEPGDYVVLEVRDTGCGMDAETLERIFDPFYTTKFQGRGLGLAGVLGVVRSHGGTLQVTSAPGQGTAFRVFLPRAPAGAEARRRVAREPLPGPAGAVVLVVDDDPAVRTVATRMLEARGFAIETARGGAAALERVRREPDGVDAVLLDLTMPGMGGEETFAALRRVRPGLPVVFMSGHSEEDVALRLEGRALVRHVAKPFRMETLVGRIRDVLEEAEKRDG